MGKLEHLAGVDEEYEEPEHAVVIEANKEEKGVELIISEMKL
jgi:adenylylsulfate kinase-like enzyme